MRKTLFFITSLAAVAISASPGKCQPVAVIQWGDCSIAVMQDGDLLDRRAGHRDRCWRQQ
jgi:hypothetical protein